jgi:hypothetical protein
MKSKVRDIVWFYTLKVTVRTSEKFAGAMVLMLFSSQGLEWEILVKVKNRLCIEKQSSVLYIISRSCEKVYKRETVWRLEV